MNFQNMEAFYRAGEQALEAYGPAADGQLELLRLSENATFLVRNPKADQAGGRWVLRVSRPGYHTLEELEAEIAWMKRIQEEGQVSIAAPVDNLRGQAVTTAEWEGQAYHCVMCEYVAGEAPDPFDEERGLAAFQQVGEIAGLLHRQVMGWEEGRRLSRPVWNYEALLGRQALFGDWRLCRELGEEGRRLLDETCRVIRDRLAAYGMERGKFGLIHSDLRAANLLVKDGQMWVLDFDDSGYGWHLHDLAASISFLEDSPMAGAWVEAWLEGYQKHMPFDERDRQEIPTFIMIRRIQLLAWITSHDDSDPVRIFYEGFAEKTLQMAETYLKGRWWNR